jgi:hypothetical protein
MTARLTLALATAATAAALLAGCGGGSTKSGGGGAASNPGALSAEAQSAATGDIPDNQVFLVFRDRAAAYSVKYPEGWTQRGRAGDVTFQDKNNLVHIVAGSGGGITPSQAESALRRERARIPSLRSGPARAVAVPGVGPAIKLTYTTLSPANPVTGKRVELVVDRYVLARAGHRAIVDLGTPRGVDNVDAYRLIIGSFRWL